MTYNVEVDKNACIGCGACVSECEENFELVETEDGYKAKPKKSAISDKEYQCNKAAMDICPVSAIKIKKA